MSVQLPIYNLQFLTYDLFSLVIAFLYVATLIATAEFLRRFRLVPLHVTRKVVHTGVGMTALALAIVFRDWTIAIIGPLVFIVVNYLSYRAKIFRSIELDQAGQLGTIWFPLSFVILTPLLWQQPALLAASFMPMTWGDSAAALLGSRFGKHAYMLWGRTNSVEGSLAMFVFGLMATYFALVLFGQSAVTSFFAALVTALAATVLEALSPGGLDNLTVPLVSAVTLVLLSG